MNVESKRMNFQPIVCDGPVDRLLKGVDEKQYIADMWKTSAMIEKQSMYIDKLCNFSRFTTRSKTDRIMVREEIAYIDKECDLIKERIKYLPEDFDINYRLIKFKLLMLKTFA